MKKCVKAQRKLHALDSRLLALAKVSDAYVTSLNGILAAQAIQDEGSRQRRRGDSGDHGHGPRSPAR
jgi:hypothetical protein